MNTEQIYGIDSLKMFFGENGLTSTSANFIANKAKEMVENEKISNLSFITTTVKPLNADCEPTTVTVGADSTAHVIDTLEHIAKLHTLEAWLREAIKAKNKLSDDVSSINEEKYCQIVGKKYPELVRDDMNISEDNWKASLSVHDLVEYFKQQATAAVFGNFVHPRGVLSNARAELKRYIENPSAIHPTNIADYLYNYRPSVKPEIVEDLFFMIQNRQREAQAKFNTKEYDKEQWLKTKNDEESESFKEAWRKWSEETGVMRQEYRQWQNEQRKAIRDLKIIIPNSLKSIYDEVNALGKD